MKYLIAIVSIAALALGAYTQLQRSTPVAVAQNADLWRDWQFNDLEGVAQPMSRYKGKTVVINFWATWCPPCVEEMPDLNRLRPELHSKNVELIGIAIDSPSQVKAFLQKRNIDYPIYLGGLNGTEWMKTLGNPNGGLPFTVILDVSGKVMFSHLGRVKNEDILKAIQ